MQNLMSMSVFFGIGIVSFLACSTSLLDFEGANFLAFFATGVSRFSLAVEESR